MEGEKKIMSPCDVEALKKCLEEHKGNHSKCQSHIDAFKSSCSLKKPTTSPYDSAKLSTAGEEIKRSISANFTNMDTKWLDVVHICNLFMVRVYSNQYRMIF